MTYALILPPELLRELALIRKQCKESIRSVALEGIKAHSSSIIEGMISVHGKDFVNKLYAVVDSEFEGS